MSITIIIMVTGAGLYLFFLLFSLSSFWEKESRAGRIALMAAHLLPLPFILAPVLLPYHNNLAAKILLLFLLICLMILFFPLRRKVKREVNKSFRYDERDTMFARRDLKPGTKGYEDYYSRNPEKLQSDLSFRSKPGLLSEGSAYFNPLAFAAAEASFHTIAAVTHLRKNEVINASKRLMRPEEITAFLKGMLLKAGAKDVGFTEMQPYHYYSFAGRKERAGSEIIMEHKYGIAILVEMDEEMVAPAPDASIVMESAARYLTSGIMAIQCAETIRNLGYGAKAHIDGNYDLICPVVAADAGLGEIGRMGLLMHRKYGPRVRIAVVTTDLPLVVKESSGEDSVINFCNICGKCADTCPGQSIKRGERKEINGSLRWQIDQESCFTYWCIAGTDCGRCMAVCPYSHGKGTFHNFVRWGIRNNFLFARMALLMDDIFYGRKPAPKELPSWIM